MASVIAVGDLVLLEHHAGHRLSVRTTTLSVVRKGSPAQAVEPVAAEPESPTLFD